MIFFINTGSSVSDKETFEHQLHSNKTEQLLYDNSQNRLLASDLLKQIDTCDVNKLENNIANKNYDDIKSVNRDDIIENNEANQKNVCSINSEECIWLGVLLLPKGYCESSKGKQEHFNDIKNKN